MKQRVSEKTVNIKITASTKDFSNAIDKAQKQIENLAEAIDSLGSSKFGEKLEEQLDSLLKALKKAEEQISDMQKSLDDLGKNKFDKLEDQFKEIVDSSKDVNEKVEDILDLLDKVDKQDLNGLEKEFDQIKNALESIKKETNDSTDTMEKSFREVTDEVDKFIKELNNIEDTKLEDLEESIKDMDKYIDEAAESVSEFNKQTDELDDKELNEYLDTLIDVTRASDDVRDSLKKAFGSLNGQNNELGFNISGKDKGSIVSDLAGELLGATVVGNKLEKAMEGIADSIDDVAKSTEKLNDALDDKSIDELGDDYRKAESAMEKLTEEYDDLIKKQKEQEKTLEDSNKALKKHDEYLREIVDAFSKKKKELSAMEAEMDGYKKTVEDSNKALADYNDKVNDWTKRNEEQKKRIEDVSKAYVEATEKVSRLSKEQDELAKSYQITFKAMDDMEKAGNVEGLEMARNAWRAVAVEITNVHEELEKARKEQEALAEECKKEDGRVDDLVREREALEQINKTLQEQRKDVKEAENAYNSLIDKYDKLRKEVMDLEDAYEEAEDENFIKQLQAQADRFDLGRVKKQSQEAAEELGKIKERMAEINKVAQGHADEFDKQYKAYEKLSQRVKDYLENEENGILLREKVAKSFREVANSMEAVYKDASKLNNAKLIDDTLAEAAEHLKELNLVSTENLQADLKRLGEVIEDKTEKIKRFKELNKEFGSEANKAASGLDKQAKDIRDWANSADFAIEAAETLTNAWGDLNAAGEDHQKIRERTKYIEDFGEALEKNVAQIRNNHKELETLDEIYEKCTDKERGILEDYKMWEKNKDALLEYNRAITDYMRTLKDTGGEIDSKFLDELGKFSPQKFIDNFEKMGASSIVLSKQINAVKIELLESIKQYKENAEAARENAEQSVRNAETALEEAKANKKNAESQEEYKEAVEKVKKAQQELADAKKKAKNYDNETLETLRDQIQEYNRLAAAMREIGMAAQDLGKSDIEKFNKSLASMLDRLGTFENDIPKTFGDIKEDIMALFSDMDSLDFGGIFDGLKNIGAGILSKIPTELKIAAAAAWALEEALRACAKAGIEQLGEGIDTVKSALSGMVGIARDVGQEIRDAFENITGMQMDFSSLIEIPIEFESQMAKVGAIAGVTGEAFTELEKKARELGATTRYSATEVAEAMEYMGMAGWNNTEIMDGLESVLNLATVAQMDLGQASDFVTDGLTALGLKAEDAAYMVDILAKASTSSNTSVAQMQRAFTNCAPVLGTLTQNLEDPKEALKELSIALGLMADKGVKGAKAGTALKNLMANMSAPTEKQLAYMKKFNLEAAQQDIVNGRLLDGIKKMKAALKDLSPQQQNAIITTIAGKEALSGISALLNTTEGDLADLESALNDCDGAAKEMADNFDDTVKGALLGLASAMQERLLQIFDKTKDSIKGVTKQLTEFFNIWNGFSTLKDANGNVLTGLGDALAYLEEQSRGWGQAISDALYQGIGAINDFVNSDALDNLLQIGTNIINGIADGIKRAADNGTLQSAITGAIRKIGTWFVDNLETIVEIGEEIVDAISQGISENQDVISRVIREVIDMQTKIDNAIAYEKWKQIGANLGTFIWKGFTSKVTELFSGIGGFLTGLATGGGGNKGNLKEKEDSDMLTTEDGGWTFIPNQYTGGQWVYTGKKNGEDYANGVKEGVNSKKEDVGNAINKNFTDAKVKTDTTASQIGQGISDNILAKLETMDASALKELSAELQNLQTTVQNTATAMGTSFATIRDLAKTNFMSFANIVRNQMLNVTNIIRNQMLNSANIINNQVTNARNALTTQFISMASVTRTQMVNISNIVRNQAVTWANIIKNQVTNARNTLTSQFLSMAAVARTQMVNVSNIIRNQSSNWASIIGNQAKTARDNLTRQFMSMASVVATQMKKCLTSVQSYMNQIAKATNKSMNMSVNVNKTVTTKNISASSGIGGSRALSADAIYAANNASIASLAGNAGALYGSASYAMSTGGSLSGIASGGENITLEIPVMLDGREVARATAKYVDNELKLITKRENRKRGAK